MAVVDFGIKYTNQADVDHLINTFQEKYPFKVDWEAKQYIGIDLKWDYKLQELRTSMEGFVEQALKEFKHSTPKQQYKGSSHIDQPKYGQTVQYVKVDTSPSLMLEHIKFLQRVMVKFLFYARAIGNTMIHAINTIASSDNIESADAATTYFLNYAPSNPMLK